MADTGRRIALLDDEFAVIRTVGPNRRWTNGATQLAALAPTASADGETIAFARVNGFLVEGGVSTSQPPGSGYAYSTAIHVVRGGDDRRVTEGVLDDSPDLAPDGGQLVFRRGVAIDEQGAGVFVADLASGSERRIAAASPETGWSVGDWSPKGDVIVLLRQNLQREAPIDLVIVRPDGSVVSERPVPGLRYTPSWSPDGRRLAFAVVPPDSGGVSELMTYDPTAEVVELVPGTRSSATFLLGWGRDGLRFVADGRTWRLPDGGERQLVLGRKETIRRVGPRTELDPIVAARC